MVTSIEGVEEIITTNDGEVNTVGAMEEVPPLQEVEETDLRDEDLTWEPPLVQPKKEVVDNWEASAYAKSLLLRGLKGEGVQASKGRPPESSESESDADSSDDYVPDLAPVPRAVRSAMSRRSRKPAKKREFAYR